MGDYDDYDDGYDDEYEETMRYVGRVKQQLKTVKLSDNQIIKKLEETNYNVDKTVLFFKQKDKDVVQAKQPSNSASKQTPKVQPKQTSTVAAPKGNVPVPAAVVDIKPAMKSEVLLSDDELIESSTVGLQDVSISGVKAGGGTESQAPLVLVVTGHVDAGKSTLIGNLLYKCGLVTQRTMHKYEKDSKSIGKQSFSLAWVTDESTSERERGVTIDVAERLVWCCTVVVLLCNVV
jgi:hypothetical protein